MPLFNPAVYSTVALNFQTPGYEMDLNTGRFLINGQCGYVLKPAYLRQLNTTFDPECPGPPRTTLTVQVSSLPVTSLHLRSRLAQGKEDKVRNGPGMRAAHSRVGICAEGTVSA